MLLTTVNVLVVSILEHLGPTTKSTNCGPIFGTCEIIGTWERNFRNLRNFLTRIEQMNYIENWAN